MKAMVTFEGGRADRINGMNSYFLFSSTVAGAAMLRAARSAHHMRKENPCAFVMGHA
jgi:hypothetical protein